MSILENGWQRLTRPHPSLMGNCGRKARFLSGLLLFLSLFAVAVHLVGFLFPSQLPQQLLLTATTIILFVFPVYLLSRTAHYEVAALLASYALAALIFVLGLLSAGEPLPLALLFLPVLLSSVLLSLRSTAFLAASILLCLALATVFSPDRAILIRIFFLNALSTGLLLLTADHQRVVNREREAVLRESEARFRTLSEKALAGVYIIQDDLFRYVNPALARLFGYSPEEIVDRLGPLDLTLPDHRDEVRNNVDERIQGHLAEVRYLLHGLRKDGEAIECEVLGSTMEYNGRPALIGTLIDVTNKRQMEEADAEQRAFLEALKDTAAALNSTLDLDQMIDRILENVGRVVPHDGANIMLIENNIAHIVSGRGHYETLNDVDRLLDITFPLERTYNFSEMVRTGRPIVIADTHGDPQWNTHLGSEWIRSYVGAPISRGGETIGFLNLDSRQAGFFNEEHASRLQAFADQVAIAMQNARLFHDLESYSESLEQAVVSRTVELRRTTEQVEVILNNSPDAVLLLRGDSAVQMANPAFYEMFGYSENNVLQQSLPSLVASGDESRFFAALESVLKRGKRARLELQARRKDGTVFDADIALTPVIDGDDVRGGVCSIHDISRLKEVDRMKDAFVSNVSHELRTPITSLRLYHDLLLRNPDKREVYLQRQEREIERLNTIIEDLLRLSRLDRGQLDVSLQMLPLNDLVSQYVLDRRPLAAELGLELLWQPSARPLMVRADRGLLEQVVGILLTNAFNYTMPESTVTILTAVGHHDDRAWATCAVSDCGPGIDSRELPLLFDRFFRGAAAQQSRNPGTGLGLAIAREIIERHDGFIEAANREDVPQGAIFTIWLPLFDHTATA